MGRINAVRTTDTATSTAPGRQIAAVWGSSASTLSADPTISTATRRTPKQSHSTHTSAEMRRGAWAESMLSERPILLHQQHLGDKLLQSGAQVRRLSLRTRLYLLQHDEHQNSHIRPTHQQRCVEEHGPNQCCPNDRYCYINSTWATNCCSLGLKCVDSLCGPDYIYCNTTNTKTVTFD